MKQGYNTKNTISRSGVRNQSTVVPENTQERLSEKSNVSSDSDISSLTKSSYADLIPTATPVNYHDQISVYPTLYDSNSSSLQSSSSDNSSLGSFSSSVLRSSDILSSNNSSSEQVRYPQPTQITQPTRNSRCLGNKCTISGGKQKTKTKRKKQSRKTKKKSNKKKSNKKNIKH